MVQNIKYVKTLASFTHVLKKNSGPHLKTLVNSNHPHFVMINIIINFIFATLLFLCIVLSRYSLTWFSYLSFLTPLGGP